MMPTAYYLLVINMYDVRTAENNVKLTENDVFYLSAKKPGLQSRRLFCGVYSYITGTLTIETTCPKLGF